MAFGGFGQPIIKRFLHRQMRVRRAGRRFRQYRQRGQAITGVRRQAERLCEQRQCFAVITFGA